MWEILRAKKLAVEFRRQVPIGGRFIADFCAPELRLIVEIDGVHHSSRRQADARRDESLRRAGYRVLRLEAELVEHHLPVAVERIRAELEAARSSAR